MKNISLSRKHITFLYLSKLCYHLGHALGEYWPSHSAITSHQTAKLRKASSTLFYHEPFLSPKTDQKSISEPAAHNRNLHNFPYFPFPIPYLFFHPFEQCFRVETAIFQTAGRGEKNLSLPFSSMSKIDVSAISSCELHVNNEPAWCKE